MRSTPRLSVPARLISLFAAIALVLVSLPAYLAQTAQPAAAAQSGTCAGWTSGANTYTTRRMQYTSDGVLHLIGCGETFTLTQIRAGINGNTIVGSEPADALVLVDAPAKIWMLNVRIRIEEGATLNLTGGAGGDVNWLRMKSGPSVGYISIVAVNSNLLIQSTRVSSWDPATGAFDFTDRGVPGSGGGVKQRSFVAVRSDLAAGRATTAPTACSVNGGTQDFYEGRMDIIGSRVEQLGYYGAEAYGLSWKVLGRDASITPPNSREIYNRVDVFGNITNSTITGNFFGGYTFGAYCMNVSGNNFDDNYYYGFDPHDDSDRITVNDNTFNGNGGHGFICSVFCSDLVVTNNEANGNGRNGFMLHRRTDGTRVEGNTANNNGDSGLAIFDSYSNTVRNNTFINNSNAAIRFSVGASGNTIENNTLSRASGAGNGYLLYSFTGSDTPTEGGSNRITGNTFRDNTMTSSNSPIVRFEDADSNLFENNTITVNGNLTTFLFVNTRDNIVRGNVVSSSPRVLTTVGSSAPTERTILENLTIGQSVVVQHDPAGTPSTLLRDSRSNVWQNVITRAGTVRTDATLAAASTTITTLDFTVKPSSNAVDVNVQTWNTAAPYNKAWTENAVGGGPGAVQHTVGNLLANTCYAVTANGASVGNFIATGSGANARMSFTYNGPYSGTVTFAVSASLATCDRPTPTPTNTATAIAGEPTISLNKTKSKFNGVVTVTLSGYAPLSNVTVTWQDGRVLATKQVDASGNGSTTFRTPMVPLGNYTVTGRDGTGRSDETSLRVIPRILLGDTSGPEGLRTGVHLYGFDPGNRVEVRWYNLAGTSYEVLAVETIASTGRGQTPIFVPEGTGAGTHRVVAKVIGISRSVSTTFEVTGPAAAQESIETPTAAATATIEASAEATSSAETGTPVANPTGDATTEPTAEVTTEPTLEPTVEPTATEEVEPTATEEATATDEAEPTATEAAPVDEETSEDTTEPTPYAVVQTSRSSTTESGALAIDEDAATVWQSSEGVDPGRTVTLTLDYGDPVAIDHVRLLPGATGLMGTATIETSNDGENWTFYAQPDPAAADGWMTVELGDGDTSAEPVQPAGPVNARYLRIVFVSDGTTVALGGVAEIETWGPAEQP